MAWIWVPHMTNVKMAKSNASNSNMINKTVVTGGEYAEQPEMEDHVVQNPEPQEK